eukprot:COSAG02_NODE_21809_length_774_cov_1.293333_1_plen_173_part_10
MTDIQTMLTQLASCLCSSPRKVLGVTMAAEKIKAVLHDKDERDEIFSKIDGNGNGILSLAEIDGFVKAEYPGEFHKQALIRAYKAADVSKDGLIERPEFFKCGCLCMPLCRLHASAPLLLTPALRCVQAAEVPLVLPGHVGKFRGLRHRQGWAAGSRGVQSRLRDTGYRDIVR